MRQAENVKFRQEANARERMRSVGRFVPLGMEEFGRLGRHMQARMHEVAEVATPHRQHLCHLPDDSPQARRFLQMLLKDWRQRLSITVNLMHAIIILERSTRSTPQRGDRAPAPAHILHRA